MKNQSINIARLASFLVVPAIITFALTLQSGTSKGEPKSYKLNPPGTLQMSDNFFFDQGEVTNFHWLEYMYWTSKVFGQDSPQYKAALPDTTQWLQEGECLQNYATNYLRHPAYRDYPVVGISYEQAQAYCDWRSERVFEYTLIREGVIDWNKDATAETYFTIDKYFKGNYKILKSRPDIVEVPVYRLPTEEEWTKAQSYFEGVQAANLNRRHLFHGKAVRKVKAEQPVVGVEVCDAGKIKTEPTAPGRENYITKSAGHMDGNVSEWLQGQKAIGANWKEKSVPAAAVNVSKPSNTIGFRCVCEWKTRS